MLTDWPNEAFPIEDRHEIFLMYSLLQNKRDYVNSRYLDTMLRVYNPVDEDEDPRHMAVENEHYHLARHLYYLGAR
jgi:hypothetical protein